jgi:hypothetical protein
MIRDVTVRTLGVIAVSLIAIISFFFGFMAIVAQASGSYHEALDASEFERSILSLSITRAIPDPDSPWAVQNIDLSGVSGVVVGDNRVLTLATNVSHAVYIQAKKVDDFEKIPMKVVFADYEVNLAILAPADGYKLSGVRIMPVGPDVPLGLDVSLVAIENERQLLRLPMRAMEIGIREAAISGLTVPMYTLSGPSRSQCKADAIVRKGLLTGLCVMTLEGQPQAITAGVIAHFLQDRLSVGSYRGFGATGLSFQPVRSPWHRKLLGVPKGQSAIRVSFVMETSPFNDCTAVDDVIYAFDNVRVDHRGFFNHSQWGPVPIRNYILTKYAGDSITLHFARAGKPMNCTRVLRRYNSLDNLVPGLTHDSPAQFLIFGGLILRELNADYLMSFGRDWIRSAPADFAVSYAYLNFPRLTRQRILILSNVLSDVFNAGYEKFGNLVLFSVNGKSISSLDDLKLKLKMPGIQRAGAEFATFDFKNGKQIVLPYAGLEDAHRRIAQVYAVGDTKSFFVRDTKTP